MDEIQNLQQKLNAAEEALITAQDEHARAEESRIAAEVALGTAPNIWLSSHSANVKQWRILRTDGTQEDPECLGELLSKCYTYDSIGDDTIVSSIDSADNSSTTLKRLVNDRPDLQKLVAELQRLKDTALEATGRARQWMVSVRNARFTYVLGRMMLRAAEPWRRKLDGGSLHSIMVSASNLDKFITAGTLQGTEKFVPAKGGAPKSALEVVSRRKEFLVAASLLKGLLTEPPGDVEREAANFDAGMVKCWSFIDANGFEQGPISAAVAQTWMRDYNWTGRELVHHHTATVKDQVTIDSLQSIVAAVNAEVAAAQPRLKAALVAKLRERLAENVEQKQKHEFVKLMDKVFDKWWRDMKAGRLPPPKPPAQPPPPTNGHFSAHINGRQPESAAFPALEAAAHRAASAAAGAPGSPRPTGGIPPPTGADAPSAQLISNWRSSNGGLQNGAQHKEAASWDDAARDRGIPDPGSLQASWNGEVPGPSIQGSARKKRSRWDAAAAEPKAAQQNGSSNGHHHRSDAVAEAIQRSNNGPGVQQKGHKRPRNGEVPSQVCSPRKVSSVRRSAEESNGWPHGSQDGRAASGEWAASPAGDTSVNGRPTAAAVEHTTDSSWLPDADAPALQAAGCADAVATACPAAEASPMTAAAAAVSPHAAGLIVQAMGGQNDLPEKQAGSPASLPNGQPPSAHAAKSGAAKSGSPAQKAGEAPTLQRSRSGKRELVKFTPPAPHPTRKSVFNRLTRPDTKQPPTFSAPAVWGKGADVRRDSDAQQLPTIRVLRAAPQAPAQQNGGSLLQASAGADDSATKPAPASAAMDRRIPDQAVSALKADLIRSAVWEAPGGQIAAEPAPTPGDAHPAKEKQSIPADRQAQQELHAVEKQPATALDATPNGLGTPRNGLQPHSTSGIETRAVEEAAALSSPEEPPQLCNTSSGSHEKAAAAASAVAGSSTDRPLSRASAQVAAQPEAPLTGDAAAAAAGGSSLEVPPAAQKSCAASYAEPKSVARAVSGSAAAAVPDPSTASAAAVETDAEKAAAAVTGKPASPHQAADAPSGAAPGAEQSNADVSLHPWALPPQGSLPAQPADAQQPALPAVQEEGSSLARSDRPETSLELPMESLNAADMDVDVGREGSPSVPDTAAAAAGAGAASQEAGAEGASGVMTDAAGDDQEAKQRAIVGMRHGKPLVLLDYTDAEWREAFTEMKALLIQLGMGDRILPRGSEVPTTAHPEVTSDSEASSSDDDEACDEEESDAHGRVRETLAAGALRELMGLACNMELQPAHRNRKAVQPPAPPPAPQQQPKHARPEKSKQASVKAKALKPQSESAAVQRAKGANKAGKRPGETGRAISTAKGTADAIVLQYEGVCSRALPVEAVSRKSAIAARERQAAAHISAQPAASVEGRAGRVQARKLARSEVAQDLATWQKLQGRADDLRLGKSGVHMWGLFARKPIPANEFVIEYVGELIRRTVNDVRERIDADSDYRFRVDAQWVVDATRRGGKARFINHCCDPNCVTKTVSVGGQLHIMICSKRTILEGEELTYDYKFQPTPGEAPIPCTCGAKNCRKRLN